MFWWRCRPREGKEQVIVGQSISVTDVKLETCAECHLGEQAGGHHFHEAPKQTTHCPKDLCRSRCQQMTWPRRPLSPKSMLVADPKLAVLFTIRHQRGFYTTVTTLKEIDLFLVCACQKCFQGGGPECRWAGGHPTPSLISQSEEDAEEAVLEETVILFFKNMQISKYRPSVIIMDPAANRVHKEQRSSLCQFVLLSLSSVVSASPLLFAQSKITWQQ